MDPHQSIVEKIEKAGLVCCLCRVKKDGGYTLNEVVPSCEEKKAIAAA